MVTAKKIPERVISPKGEKIAGKKNSNDHFTGTVWLQVLVPDDSTFHCPAFNVMFGPGARNNWHQHLGGQILLVTGGKGYYQDWGRKAQEIREGEVVKILPEVKHWHGAAPDNWMSHIAISTNVQRGEGAWLEPVTDEEYNQVPKPTKER